MKNMTPDIVWIKPTAQGFGMFCFAAVLVLLSILAGASGSGGTLSGFGVACVTNPLVWLMLFVALGASISGCDAIQGKGLRWKCPHCGDLNVCSERLKKAPLGEVFSCSECKNDFRKTSIPA